MTPKYKNYSSKNTCYLVIHSNLLKINMSLKTLMANPASPSAVLINFAGNSGYNGSICFIIFFGITHKDGNRILPAIR